ncbi:The fantastic four family [Sesbania bispinosa]|nr:The fantastic four family [Sesbania bispinosa]
MSTCLQQIFENPLPENPTLLESLSLSHIKSVIKPIDHSSSFTEIFEIEYTKLVQNEVPWSSNINQTPSSPYVSNTPKTTTHAKSHKSSDSFSSLSSESLQLCTEGLGFESSDDVEELKKGTNEWWETLHISEKEAGKNHLPAEDCHGEWKSRSRVNGVEYPPPISCIGRSGKPWVSFKSYRKNGRFVLKEIRIPTQDFLHAHREDGRLKLHFVQPDEEFEEEGEGDHGHGEEDCDGVEESTEEEEENDESVSEQLNEEKKIVV